MRVAVVGGGPAGAVAAMELARLGVAVRVFERAAGPRNHPGDCLSPAFEPLLARLGLRGEVEQGPHRRVYGNRAVWGSDAAVDSDFFFRRNSASWRLDRKAFGEMLAAAAAKAGVRWSYDSAVTECRREGRAWALRAGGEAVSADFVIDATGRKAWLAARLGVERHRMDRLAALVCELEGGMLEDSFTLVEAVEHGWWYSGVLPNGRLAAMFATDIGSPAYARGRSAEGWLGLLRETRETRSRVAGWRVAAGPRAWAAGSERMAAIAGEGWLAVGDAAVAHDPISSQGIGAAMGSGYYAARAAIRMAEGDDAGRVAYVFAMQRAFGGYLDGLREQYAREIRWPDSPFWARRRAAG